MRISPAFTFSDGFVVAVTGNLNRQTGNYDFREGALDYSGTHETPCRGKKGLLRPGPNAQPSDALVLWH
jgi:hypothetical protein